MIDFIFLTNTQIEKSDITQEQEALCEVTDFAILLGCNIFDKKRYNYYFNFDLLPNQFSSWWINSYVEATFNNIQCVEGNLDNRNRSFFSFTQSYLRYIGARPAIKLNLKDQFKDKTGITEEELGEYPQDIVSEELSNTLEKAYLNEALIETGKNYTTDSVKIDDVDSPFQPKNHIEYTYNNKKYIRFISNSNCKGKTLSDGRIIQENIPYWIEVKPIKWLIDPKENIALSKKIIFSGIQYNKTSKREVSFEKSDIKKYMDKYFSKDIIPSITENLNYSEEENLSQRKSR